MKNKTDLEKDIEFLDEYYNSDERKRYSAQRIDDWREPGNDLASTLKKWLEIIKNMGWDKHISSIVEQPERKVPETFSELINSDVIEKDTALFKIYYVKNEVKKILRNKLWIYSISENNQLYLDVLKVQSWVLDSLDDINSELKKELDILVNDISAKIIDTLNKIESQPVKLIKPSDLDNFWFHDLRYILENKVYESISRIKTIPRGQIYLYSDIKIYEKLQKYYETSSDWNLDELVKEFIEFYEENEELFIERYKVNEELGDSNLLNFEFLKLIMDERV